MKKRILLFAFVLTSLLTFNSCSSDDNSPSTSGNIVGKWEYYKEGEIVNGNEYLDLYVHSAGCTKDYSEFKSDGTFVDYYYNDVCSLNTDSGTYSKVGDILTRDDGFDAQQYTILQLDNSTLKVKFTYTDAGETFTSVLIFKRIN